MGIFTHSLKLRGQVGTHLHEIIERDTVLLCRSSLVDKELLHELTGGAGGGVESCHHDELAQLMG